MLAPDTEARSLLARERRMMLALDAMAPASARGGSLRDRLRLVRRHRARRLVLVVHPNRSRS